MHSNNRSSTHPAAIRRAPGVAPSRTAPEEPWQRFRARASIDDAPGPCNAGRESRTVAHHNESGSGLRGGRARVRTGACLGYLGARRRRTGARRPGAPAPRCPGAPVPRRPTGDAPALHRGGAPGPHGHRTGGDAGRLERRRFAASSTGSGGLRAAAGAGPVAARRPSSPSRVACRARKLPLGPTTLTAPRWPAARPSRTTPLARPRSTPPWSG